MPVCRACRHPRRAEIDEMLVKGAPYRAIIAMSGLSLGGLNRHRECIKQDLASAKDRAHVAGAERGSALLARIEEVIAGAKSIASSAARSDNLATANQALNTVLRSLEIIGRITGELGSPGMGGVHFHSTRNVTTVVTITDSDAEVAMLIAEATNNYDPAEIGRLKLLAETAANRE